MDVEPVSVTDDLNNSLPSPLTHAQAQWLSDITGEIALNNPGTMRAFLK